MIPHHLVEARIREAEERGAFRGLPGLGRPIPDLDAPYDELWWVRKWIERERIDLSRERGEALAEIRAMRAERRRDREGQ